MFGVTKGFCSPLNGYGDSLLMLLLCLFRGQTVGQNLNAGLLIHRQAFSCVRHSDCLSRRHFLRPALVSLLSVISPLLMKVRQACLCVCEGVRVGVCERVLGGVESSTPTCLRTAEAPDNNSTHFAENLF